MEFFDERIWPSEIDIKLHNFGHDGKLIQLIKIAQKTQIRIFNKPKKELKISIFVTSMASLIGGRQIVITIARTALRKSTI